mgnify:FL=1
MVFTLEQLGGRGLAEAFAECVFEILASGTVDPLYARVIGFPSLRRRLDPYHVRILIDGLERRLACGLVELQI